MKRNRIIIALTYALLVAAIILVAIVLQHNKYSTYLVMNNDGYLVSQDDLTKNLLNDAIDFEDAECESTPFSISDIIYEKLGKLFIGEEKTPINDEYPLFINNQSAIMNLTGSANLITDDFDYSQTYSGLYVNDGLSFNPDMERAYREEFILLELNNGLFVNTKAMTVSGSFFVEKSIPMNSIVRFMENEIRYYELEDSTFVLSSIKPLGSNSIIKVNEKEYLYYDFLERLGLYEKDELRKKEAEEATTEDNISEHITATPIPIIIGNEKAKSAKDLADQDKQQTVEEENPVPTIIDKIPTPVAEGPTVTPKPTKPIDKNPPQEKEPLNQKPESAKPAEPAGLPDIVPPAEQQPVDNGEVIETPPEEENPGNKDWKKPEVKLKAITSSVYKILSEDMTVENPEFLYHTGVSFNIYDTSSKLIMRKSYGQSANVSVGPLKPDSEYRVVVSMEYYNKLGGRETEQITEATVRTKPLNSLAPLRFNWSNGKIFFNKIQLEGLSITNAINDTTEVKDGDGNTVNEYSYIETVQFMNRMEVLITEKGDSSVSYKFPVSSKDLAKLRTGKQVVYDSISKINSNKEYYYEFVCYDRFGNMLPFDGVVRGSTHTCKQPPKANISILKNEVKNVELSIIVENVDKADITEGSMYFSVYDSNDNPVTTSITHKDKDGNYSTEKEKSEVHAVSSTNDTIKFLDLVDYEIYKIKVFCNYDINDNCGEYEAATIGESKFTTMPISSLGYVFFDVNLKEVNDDSAVFTLSLDKTRTDSRLVQLLTNIDVSVSDANTKDGTGIGMTYSRLVDGKEENSSGPDLDKNGIATLVDSDVEFMKLGSGETEQDAGTFTFHVDDLKSVTPYNLKITPKVNMGGTDNEIYREIEAYYSPESFTTLKKSPVIDIDAIYASSNFIKLYGVSVNDPDGAILKYPVTISVFDEEEKQIASYELLTKDKVSLVDFGKLEKNKVYTFRFFAEEYNNGYDRTTYRKNYELYYSELFESKKYLTVTTREAVSGSIDLVELDNNKVMKQMEIPAKDMTSYNPKAGLYQGYRFGSNNQTRVKYSLMADFGMEQWNSFQIGYSYVNKTTKYQIYLVDPDTNPSAKPIAEISASEKTMNTETCRWTDTNLLKDGVTLSGQQKLYIVATTVDGAPAVHCLWGVRFQKTQQSDASHYFADLNVLVNDSRKELGDIPSYRIKIYKDEVWVETRRHEWKANEDGTYTLRMYNVAPDKTETLVDTKVFNGEERICDTNFYYEVEKGYHSYRFELWATVYDYDIKLDQEEVTTEEEIIGIRTAQDLANVRFGLSKKYYVLNDIDFPKDWNNITASQTFNGEIDFRGFTLRYNSPYALITTLGFYGSLKNMVFTYGDGWGTDTERKTDRIVTYNYGTIQNLMVMKNNGNYDQSYKTDSAGICYMNYESGIIENFVVKLVDPLISTNYVAGVCNYNRGKIRNGYIYGQPIKMTSKNIDEIQYSANNFMGGIVTVNRQVGVVENVYSLIDIQTRELKTVNDYVFDLIGLNDGVLRNSFSIGDVFYGGEIREGYGPAYRNRYNGSLVTNTYYYSEKDYGKTDNPQIAKAVLYDRTWYSRLFNESGSSKKNQFNLEPVQMGYYPHVVWPDVMPEQEYIELPVLAEDDQIDIIDAYITEQGEDYAKAVITVDNPDKFEITDIKVKWLNTEIISQEEDTDGFYRVTVRLTQAADTKYFSAYAITSFTYSLGFRDLVRTVDYKQGEEPTIPAEFYKPVTSVADWAAIKNDYTQNYRLTTDLDFEFLAPDICVIPANVALDPNNANFNKDAFSGKLDGNHHTLKFTDTGTFGFIIGKLKGTVKNLTIENLDVTEGKVQYKGFIGRMLQGSIVDNVHILGMEAVSYENCGAIAGDVFAAKIINSSAHDVHIKTSADGNYAQYVGGLIGKHRLSGTNTIYANLTIQNCYVDGVDIEVLSAGDCGGAGGLAGFVRASAEIYNVYVVNGSIDTVYQNAGGLIGAVDTFTNSESSYYMLKDYYVDVDITSITERAGGIIGFTTVSNGELEENGLALGNIATSKPMPEQVGRFYGYNKYAPNNVYGYELSIVNGIINTKDELLTYDQLCNLSTYEKGGLLYWNADFVRDAKDLSEGIMPKLNEAGGNELLPYQEDYKLEKNPITVTSIQSKNYSSGDLFVVRIETEHSADITITGATFNGLLAANLENPSDAVKITTTETGTVLEYVLSIEGYYDTYYLTGLTYTREGDTTSHLQSMYLSVGILPQYLKIDSAKTWNDLMTKEAYGQKRYNIQITGDLDFSAYFGKPAKGVIVNRIMGSELTKGSWKKIKGINLEGNESFITAVYGDVSYLSFEDITLTKPKLTYPDAINSYGLINAVTGKVHDVNFQNITIDSYNSSYVGLVAQSYGMNYNNYLSGITVKGTYGTLPSKRAVGGFIGRLSGSGGVHDTFANKIIVEGRDYVGGIVGIQEDGRYLWNIEINNSVVSTGISGTYVGGIAGFADSTSLADVSGSFKVQQVVVTGNTCVGGVYGRGCILGDTAMTNNQNDSYETTVDKVFVTGAGNSAGGVVGQGVVRRAQVRESEVFGLYYIGGITGNGSAYYTSCTDSIISTVYDRELKDTGNARFCKYVNDKILNYKDLIGKTTDTSELAVYNKAVDQLGYLVSADRKSAWSVTSFSGNNNSRIGGISGRTISVANSIVANCKIGSFGAIGVGGIVSRTELSSYNNGAYRIMSCGTQNCEIFGADDVGGIVGAHLRGYIKSCYSNSTVTATKNYAGGIAGRVRATNLYSLSETPYASQVYYAGTVTATDYAAGIFGRMEQDLYNINEGWLMLGKVAVTNPEGHADYFMNQQDKDARGITKAMVYEDSSISIGANSKAAKIFYQENPLLVTKHEINLVNTSELKTKSTYITKLNWSSDTAGFSVRYWDYNGLVNSYMPYLTYAPTNNYNQASAVKLLRYQEGYTPDPNNKENALVENGMYVYEYMTYKGGVPIPGSGAPIVKKALFVGSGASDSIPKAQFYAVDADKINIEFTEVNPEASFKIVAAGETIAESKITKRTFTLNYDFISELEVIVSDGTGESSYSIYPEDVCRNIMTWKDEYYYITASGIMGSGETLSGQYVNLYAGHAIDAYGTVIDLETGLKLRAVNETSLTDLSIPLHSFQYDSYGIETYKNYSLVNLVAREKLRLYVKNAELSAISSGMPIVADSLILDNYNGSRYCSVLDTGGTILDMTNCKLKYPEDFDNSGIQYMTTNLDSTNHIVLVRYYDGAVAGFNYITGEKLDINSPRGTVTEYEDENGFSGRSKNISLVNFDSLYIDVMDFETNLIDIGWAEVNGINSESGQAVADEGAEINGDASVALYLEESFVMDDGTVVGEKTINQKSNAGTMESEQANMEPIKNEEPDISLEPDSNMLQALENSHTITDIDTLKDNISQLELADITSVKAALEAAESTGVTQEDIDALRAAIEKLKDKGVSKTEIVELEAKLTKIETDNSLIKDGTATSDKSSDQVKESVKSETEDNEKEKAEQEKAEEEKTDKKDNVKQEAKDNSAESTKGKKQSSEDLGNSSTTDITRYVPVYDPDSSKYVIYDEEELLMKKDKELESMNDKVERSGHMIDYRSRQQADIENPGDENIYGYILLALAIIGIALLLSSLILRKQKEGTT